MHVGGLEDVDVLQGGGGHLAGQGNVPYLMCESCGVIGQRRLPSATDILVIAEELDMTDIKLARVGRISAGNWNNTNAWIGADVPDATQDAYVRGAGAVTVDVNATVKSLVVDAGSSVDAAGFQLTSLGDVQLFSGTLSVGAGGKVAAGAIRYDGGSVSVSAGGTISADSFHGEPATFATAAGSTVAFNDFTRGVSSATAATFNGNVNIGVIDDSEDLLIFNPETITNWTIGQNLHVGGQQQRPARLEVDNGTWNVGGNLTLSLGEVIVDAGNGVSGGSLNIAGSVEIRIDSELVYRGSDVSNTTYLISGGQTSIKHQPPSPPQLEYSAVGQLTFENTSGGNIAKADSVTLIVYGGSGDGGDGGVVTFKDQSEANNAHIITFGGSAGPSLRLSHPLLLAGEGGRVEFRDASNVYQGDYKNYGVDAAGAVNSGGGTYFYDNSYVQGATFDNYGSTLQSSAGGLPAPGGRTGFQNEAKASYGVFNNHAGQGSGTLGAGITEFRGESNAGASENPDFNTTYNNLGGQPGAQYGGAVEFYGLATAGKAVFNNLHANGVAQNAGSAGNVRFYGGSNAGTATFHNQVGGGAVYFNDASSAANAKIYIEDTGTGTFGGHLVFNGGSKGGMAKIFVRENAFSSTVEFRGTSDAEGAELLFDPGWNGLMLVTNSANLGSAKVDVGATNGGGLLFRESGKAGGAMIRLRPGANADFTGANTNAQNATFTLDGATVSNGGTGSLGFSGANAGNATIYVNAGTAFNASGAQLSMSSGTNAGTATIIGGGATVPGAGGGRITIDASSNFTNATMSVGDGGYLAINGFGAATVGSLDVTGTAAIYLQQAELRVGSLNTSNTISGQISGFFNNGNAKITKVGTGTLTLTGANAYYGLTKVDGGTLVQNGTNPGPAEVTSGAILKGTGGFGGIVTVNAGGTLAPGASPGKITVGGITLSSGSTLAMELGGTIAGTQYDQVVSTGAFSLAGALDVALVNGFAPVAGQSFNLLDWGTLSGTFSSLLLPSLSGLAWDTSQLYTAGVISLATAGLPGDYNQNGTVDAADYVVWRNGLGTTHTQSDYDTWRTNFGRTAGAGSSSALNTAVPEPGVVRLAILGLATMVWLARATPLRRS